MPSRAKLITRGPMLMGLNINPVQRNRSAAVSRFAGGKKKRKAGVVFEQRTMSKATKKAWKPAPKSTIAAPERVDHLPAVFSSFTEAVAALKMALGRVRIALADFRSDAEREALRCAEQACVQSYNTMKSVSDALQNQARGLMSGDAK